MQKEVRKKDFSLAKRLSALMLSLALVVSMMPAMSLAVFAEDTDAEVTIDTSVDAAQEAGDVDASADAVQPDDPEDPDDVLGEGGQDVDPAAEGELSAASAGAEDPTRGGAVIEAQEAGAEDTVVEDATVEAQETAVAKNTTTGTGYATLAAAVADASAGDTIQMLADESYTDTVTIDKNLTLDLNGKTVSSTTSGSYNATITVSSGTTVTIKDTSENKDGKVINSGRWSAAVYNYGTFILEAGSLEGGDSTYGLVNGSNATSATINGGTVSSSGEIAIYTYGKPLVVNEGATISGGYCSIETSSGFSANVTINGGTIYNKNTNGVGPAVRSRSGNITINGGTISGTHGLEIDGGTITVPETSTVVVKAIGSVSSKSALTGSSGTFSIAGGWYSEKVADDYVAYGYKATDVMSNAPDAAAPYTVEATRAKVSITFDEKYAAIAQTIAGRINNNDSDYSAAYEDGAITLYYPMRDSEGNANSVGAVEKALSTLIMSCINDTDNLTDWCIGVGQNSIDYYTSFDDLYAEEADSTNAIQSGQVFISLWEVPVTEIALEVENPVCGTVIETGETKEYGSYNTPKPSVTITKGEMTLGKNYWAKTEPTSGYYEISGNEYTGKIVGDNSYIGFIEIYANFGYIINASKLETVTLTIDGEDEDISGYGSWMGGIRFYYDVTAVHDTVETIKDGTATCTEAGTCTIVTTCNGCELKETKENQTQEALGHDWGEWTVTKEPTNAYAGEQTRVCSRCGEKETQAIAKLDTSEPVLVAKGIASGKKAVKLSWNNVGADRYVIYMARCNYKGKTYSYKKIGTVSGTTLKFKKKGLKKNTAYKFYVVAEKASGGQYEAFAQSVSGHFYTGNVRGRFTNPKSLKLNKTSFTLSTGSTATVKGAVKKVKSSKKLATSHASKLRFTSSNPTVATVDASGKITAKSPGTATIYVQTINGIWKTCTVTVN